jgi:hypothetical protein
MKKILFILSILFTLNSFGQNKIVKIPQSELDAFFLAIDTLEYQDSLNTVLIADLEMHLLNKTHLNFTNETIVMNQESEIQMLNDQIKLFEDRLKITDRWYNKRWFGVVVGVVSTSTVIYIAGQLD